MQTRVAALQLTGRRRFAPFGGNGSRYHRSTNARGYRPVRSASLRRRLSRVPNPKGAVCSPQNLSERRPQRGGRARQPASGTKASAIRAANWQPKMCGAVRSCSWAATSHHRRAPNTPVPVRMAAAMLLRLFKPLLLRRTTSSGCPPSHPSRPSASPPNVPCCFTTS